MHDCHRQREDDDDGAFPFWEIPIDTSTRNSAIAIRLRDDDVGLGDGGGDDRSMITFKSLQRLSPWESNRVQTIVLRSCSRTT